MQVLEGLGATIDRVVAVGVGEHFREPGSATAPLLQSQTGPLHTIVVQVPLDDDRQVLLIDRRRVTTR